MQAGKTISGGTDWFSYEIAMKRVVFDFIMYTGQCESIPVGKSTKVPVLAALYTELKIHQ